MYIYKYTCKYICTYTHTYLGAGGGGELARQVVQAALSTPAHARNAAYTESGNIILSASRAEQVKRVYRDSAEPGVSL